MSGAAVELVPVAAEQREAFVDEEVANYADEQIRDSGWPPGEALARARDELTPQLRRELAAGTARGDRLWAAVDARDRTVGWLWVKSLEPGVAFLEQITVARPERRRGHGRSMLAAVEPLLVGEGIGELRLHVNRANEPALALYAAAGFYANGGDERRLFLRKRLRGVA